MNAINIIFHVTVTLVAFLYKTDGRRVSYLKHERKKAKIDEKKLGFDIYSITVYRCMIDCCPYIPLKTTNTRCNGISHYLNSQIADWYLESTDSTSDFFAKI